jgi:hypothetical protein
MKGLPMKQSKKAAKTRTRTARAEAQGEVQSALANTRSRRDGSTKVMGVTVPKTLANALDTLINSARGREILATALVAGASAAAAALTKSSDRGEATKARQAAADAGKQFTQDLSDAAAGVVAGIVNEAARTLLPRSLTRETKKESGTGSSS